MGGRGGGETQDGTIYTLYIRIIYIYAHILYIISADPCRQQGERVRGGLTSNKMPEGAKSLCRTKASSRRTRAGWQLAVEKRRKAWTEAV